MSKINQAILGMHMADAKAAEQGFLHKIHPLAKLTVTIMYLILVLSFPRYDLIGLLGMGLYLMITIILGEISIKRIFPRLCILLLPVLLLGAVNPIMDRTVFLKLDSLMVTGGMVSLLNLLIKASFAIFATFLLMETTTMQEICYAMQMLHMPSVLITQILLMHRYLVLMLKEVEKITLAYSLRAPGQKGIHYKAWGSLVGRMLLGSMDRGEMVYESMLLRGFTGRFYAPRSYCLVGKSVLFATLWLFVLTVLRIWPIFRIVGGWLSI